VTPWGWEWAVFRGKMARLALSFKSNEIKVCFTQKCEQKDVELLNMKNYC